jgi:hypothetical protein
MMSQKGFLAKRNPFYILILFFLNLFFIETLFVKILLLTTICYRDRILSWFFDLKIQNISICEEVFMPTVVRKMEAMGEEFLSGMLEASIKGHCYFLAIALHRNLGWPIVGLTDNLRIIHAGVISPEGKIWDGRGEVSKEDFVRPFLFDDSFEVREVTEEMLLATGTVDDFGVEFILKKAQTVWPELPWKHGRYEDRIIAFADELEALSRKHGLWVAGAFPATLPIIFEGDGDEVGYEVQQTPDGNAYTINRMLG